MNETEIPTPRTDKKVWAAFYHIDVGEIDVVDADFARQLERENAAMREAIWEAYGVIATVEALWPVWCGTPDQMIEHNKQKSALAKLQPFIN